MSHPNTSTALATAVLDQLVANGLGSVCISPGSRSGALAIAALMHEEVELIVVLDERSAAFHALGRARASGRPVAAICTSGTAAANYYPAVVEADMARVPLVVITADRPPELRGVGANQTIDQVEMFGSKVRAFEELSGLEPPADANEEWRGAVNRALALATGPDPGPVHLNIAFREPTVPVSDDGRTTGSPYPFDTPRVSVPVPSSPPAPTHDFALDADRALVIAGDGHYDRTALRARCAELGIPILATALSGMRGVAGVVTAYGRILARGLVDELRPRTVIAIGAVGPDGRLENLVSEAENRIRVDLWGRRIDPGRNATHVIGGDPLELLGGVTGSAEPGWLAGWLDANRSARAELAEAVASEIGATGGAVAAALNDIAWGALVVGSSLPIREVDAHLERAGPVHANRGASGIDGVVSTALGVAFTMPRTLAVVGDLSLLHDSNAFLHDGEIDLVVVVVDNGGGGLFDSLPQATHAPHYERLFLTPPHRDLAKLAALHGLSCREVSDVGALVEAANSALDAGGVHLLIVPVDRVVDLRLRRQLGG